MNRESDYGGYADNEWRELRARAEVKMKTGVDLIAEERQRQIHQEGWTAEHDAKDHHKGGLVRAALCYADNALPDHYSYLDPSTWPWDPTWDKRSKHGRRRSLVIAGALIAAELDRLIREEADEKTSTEETTDR